MNVIAITDFAQLRQRIDARIAERRKGALLAKPPVGLYRSGDRCAGCGMTSWHIGRSTAECAKCGHAVPLNFAGDR